jgi:hypothetical protein
MCSDSMRISLYPSFAVVMDIVCVSNKVVGYHRVVVLYDYSTPTIVVWHCFSFMCLLLVESDEGMNV